MDLCGLQQRQTAYLHIDEGYVVNGGEALYCLEASSLDVQNDVTDLCACTKTAQTSIGLLANLGLSSRYDATLCQGCTVC